MQIKLLEQCFGERADLNEVLPSFREQGDTPLHVATAQEDNSSLHLIEFLIQNSKHVNCTNREGNTSLHVAILTDQKEAIKLLLRAQADPNIVNLANKSCFDLARDLNRGHLLQLVSFSCLTQ